MDTILDLIDKGYIFSVIGEPGAGKTTACRLLVDRNLSRGYTCVHVSLDDPPSDFTERIVEDIGDEDIDENLIVVDGYSPLAGIRVEEGYSVSLTGSLSDVSITLSKALNETGEEGFLSIDSVSTLVDYYGEDPVVKFLRQLVSRLKTRGFGGLFLMIDGVHSNSLYGIVSSLSDVTLQMRSRDIEGHILRELYVTKLADVDIPISRFNYSLQKGIRVFSPFRPPTHAESIRFETISNSTDVLSTGCRDLDQLLDGGLPFGSYNLLEVVGVLPLGALESLGESIICNALHNQTPVLMLPPGGFSEQTILGILREHCDEGTIRRYFRLFYYGDITKELLHEKPYVVPLDGNSIKDDFVTAWIGIEETLDISDNGPVVIEGIDTVEAVYGKGSHLEILADSVRNTREMGGVRINVTRPGVTISQELQDISDIYLKMLEVNGGVYLYGVRPRTKLQYYHFDESKSTCQADLYTVS
jgi:KaiC/GvpD/RAD55 family RecA-like ATPase